MNFYVRVSSIGQLFYTAHVLVGIMFLSINLKLVNVYPLIPVTLRSIQKDSFVKEQLL